MIITSIPIVEPRWDNSRVSSLRDWLDDNQEALGRYYARLVGQAHGDSHDLGTLSEWLRGKWYDQVMLSQS